MGKYLRKCKGSGEITAKETTQAAGVWTRARALALATGAAASSTTRRSKAAVGRSSRRRKAAAAVPAELGASYLELRNRSVFLRPPVARSGANPVGTRRSVPEVDRISRCSSSASLEVPAEVVPPLASGQRELGEELDSATCYHSNRGERTEARDEASDLESMVETEPARRSPSTKTTMPWEAEIEEFFEAAERDERQRFTNKYNYDVVNDVPLVAGRYEWVPFAR